MDVLKRYPLVLTFPLGLFGGAILGFIYGVRKTALIAAEIRRKNPDDPLDLLWINYIMFPVTGAFLGMIAAVIAAIIIYLVYRERSNA